jgi:RNA polymerase sigma factor (sigma-70 family)
MDSELHTAVLQDLVAKHQAGDKAAVNMLIVRSTDRLKRLAGKMLGSFPAVRAKEEADDVLQNALVRLTRSLESVTPNSMREYYGLATEHIRRELLDLARHHGRRPADPASAVGEAAAPTDTRDLDKWAALQQAVERLPAEEREVFGLTFYHGWTQVQIAELLQTSDKRVRKLWHQACARLGEEIGEPPQG